MRENENISFRAQRLIYRYDVIVYVHTTPSASIDQYILFHLNTSMDFPDMVC